MQAALPLAPANGTPAPDMPSWQLLDDAAEWPAFGRALDDSPQGRWESTVRVDGMHCAACAGIVEQALAGAPGVLSAEVNPASRRARIVWRAAEGRPSQWFAAAARAGYGLRPAALELAPQREARRALWRWLVAGFCMMQVMMYAMPAYVAAPGEMSADQAQLLRWASWVLTLPVLLFSCGPFFSSAWRDGRVGRIGMDLPVVLGIVIAFAVSTVATFDPMGPLGGEVYFDSVTMFVFFLLTGRWLEARLRARTAGALDALLDRMPTSVERRSAADAFERVAARHLRVGDVVRVRPGEAFPADGQILAGQTSADEALLTGEARALRRREGDRVLAGGHNLTAPVELRVEALGPDTRFGQIARLMEGAALTRPQLALLADRAARPFLLGVLALSALAAAAWWPSSPGHALMVAVSVLIVTCPCALSLAAPAAMLASAGALARRGVIVSRLQALENLAGVDTVVFDKTGTLTQGVPRLTGIYCRRGLRPGDALERAAALAQDSLHPVARALAQAYADKGGPSGAAVAAGERVAPWAVSAWTEHAGQGVQAVLRYCPSRYAQPQTMRLGSAAFCGAAPLATERLQVHLSDGEGWAASFVLSEQLRPDAAEAVRRLKAQGLSVQLLSGDRPASVQAVAAEAGIEVARGDCTPQDKLQAMRTLQQAGRRVAMIGDGMNDTPVLAQAHVSMALAHAVPLARARADFVLSGEPLRAVPQAVAQARRTQRIVRQNLGWALAYNAIGVPFAALGWLPAWLAGLGMAASSLVVVLNAARLARPDPDR